MVSLEKYTIWEEQLKKDNNNNKKAPQTYHTNMSGYEHEQKA